MSEIQLLNTSGGTKVAATINVTGAACTACEIDGRQVIGTAPPLPVQSYTGAVLAPWPNRLAHGTWQWHDRELHLPVNEADRDAALHGLVAHRRWEATTHDDGRTVRLTYMLGADPGYPFDIELSAVYTAADDGLIAVLTAHNAGSEDAPVGLGVHPYLATPAGVDEYTLQVAATELATIDVSGNPTVAPVTDAHDLHQPRSLRSCILDHGYGGLHFDESGRATARVAGPDGEVELWAGRSVRWLMVYTADTLPVPWRRAAVAVEPMTCLPNALATGDIDVLAPGETLSMTWGVRIPRT
jgi:aldose 1-epimerase